MDGANRAKNARHAGVAGRPFWYTARLGVMLTLWACGVIARLYQRLAVLHWWWEMRREVAMLPERTARRVRWRRYLGRRRLERELRGALLGVHAAGVARGLCGQDQEAGRRLVEQVQGMWKGAKRAPVHFEVLLKSLALMSCWLGQLMLACSVQAGQGGFQGGL